LLAPVPISPSTQVESDQEEELVKSKSFLKKRKSAVAANEAVVSTNMKAANKSTRKIKPSANESEPEVEDAPALIPSKSSSKTTKRKEMNAESEKKEDIEELKKDDGERFEELEENEYEVEKIVSKIFRRNKAFYEIKWKGFPASQNTVEKEENLYCVELLHWLKELDPGYWNKIVLFEITYRTMIL
jgi:hypothetical protein